MDDSPWTEKYRPATLDGVAGNPDIVSALRRLLAKTSLPHLLFHGPPGTGKTSTWRACALQMYGARAREMVLEINASDENGIGTVRDKVAAFARAVPLFAAATATVSVKLIVLEEAEYLTPEAQAALKRVLEQVSATARFCFVCNCSRYISPAIQSRCARFRFRPLADDSLRAKVQEVAAAERLVLMPGAEAAVVAVGLGDMRRVLNTLQACAFRSLTVSAEDVYAVSGRPSPAQICAVVEAVTTLPVAAAHAAVVRLLRTGGLCLADVVGELSARAAQSTFPMYGTCSEVAAPVMCYLVSQLAKVEFALGEASEDGVQAAAVAAAFYLARHMLRSIAATRTGAAGGTASLAPGAPPGTLCGALPGSGSGAR